MSNGDGQKEVDAVHGTDGTDVVEHSEQEAGRKRKQEERTLSSQVLKTEAKRARDNEEEEVGSSLMLAVKMMHMIHLILTSSLGTSLCRAFSRHGQGRSDAAGIISRAKYCSPCTSEKDTSDIR